MAACSNCRSDRVALYQQPYGTRVLCERCMARECPGTPLEGQAAGPGRSYTLHNGNGEKTLMEAQPWVARRVAEAPRRNGRPTTGAPSAVPLFDMAQAIQDAAEPLPWIVEPLAARGYLTVLVGRPEAFKSWLMLMLGHQVHSGGGELGGLSCSEGVALYVDAENGARLMGARHELAHIPADGLLVADGTKLRLPAHAASLRGWVEQTGATLVVLDSLRRVAPGMRENESDDTTPVMAALADLAREADCAVVAIHHRSTKRNAEDVRGSSVLEDQADVVWVLEHVAKDPEPDRRRLRRRKFRIGARPPHRWLRVAFTEHGLELSEAEPYEHAPADGADDDSAATPQDQGEYIAARIRLLADHVRAEGEEHGWPPHRLAAAVGLDAQSGTFKRALSLLLDAGEWVAEGSTRARRFRPSIQAIQAAPIGDGLNGLNQPPLPGTEETDPEETP